MIRCGRKNMRTEYGLEFDLRKETDLDWDPNDLLIGRIQIEKYGFCIVDPYTNTIIDNEYDIEVIVAMVESGRVDFPIKEKDIFLKQFLIRMREYLSQKWVCNLELIEKEVFNGVVDCFLAIAFPEDGKAPTEEEDRLLFNMTQIYNQYQDTGSMDVEVAHAGRYVEECLLLGREFKVGKKEDVLKRIVFKLINRSWSLNLLSTCPHRVFLDLAVVYYYIDPLCVKKAILIDNKMMNHHQLTEEELFENAYRTTESLLDPMNPFVAWGIYFEAPDEIIECLTRTPRNRHLWNVTCKNRGYTPSYLLYPNYFADIASVMGEDLWIIPSSRYELIVLAASMYDDPGDVNTMIRDINGRFASENNLSDRVYRFDRSKCLIY